MERAGMSFTRGSNKRIFMSRYYVARDGLAETEGSAMDIEVTPL